MLDLMSGVGPEAQEPQRHIAVTIAACVTQWGPAMLLTRDTEGNTHVSTPPHTTRTRHAEGGGGQGGARVCVGVGGAWRRGTDPRERTVGGRGVRKH